MTGKVKKLGIVLLILAFSVSLLSGCGSSSQNQASSGAVSTTAAADEQTTGKPDPVTIDWLAYQTLAEPDSNAPVVKAFEEKYNAKFNFWFVDDQKYEDALNVKLASGEMPDFFRVPGQDKIAKYVKQGIIAEMPVEKIRQLAPQYAEMVDKFDTNKVMWNSTMVDGKNYALRRFNVDGTYPTTLIWRKDWLTNVGIDKVPETIDEFEDALRKFRNSDPDKNGKKDTYGLSNTTMLAVTGAFGQIPVGDFKGNPIPSISFTQKDGKITYSCIQPEMKDALAILNKWYKEGLIDPEFITGENKGGYWAISHAFTNGRIGLTGGVMFYHWIPKENAGGVEGPCLAEFRKANPNAEVILGKAPVGPGGKSGTPQWGYASDINAFTSKCVQDERKVETILKMANDLSQDYELYKLARWGIQDENYKVSADGIVTGTRPEENPTEDRRIGLMVFSFVENPEFQKRDNPPYYKFADDTRTTGYIGAYAPPTDATSKYGASLQKLVNEAYIQIITGSKPIGFFEEFVKQFKANGGDEVESSINTVK